MELKLSDFINECNAYEISQEYINDLKTESEIKLQLEYAMIIEKRRQFQESDNLTLLEAAGTFNGNYMEIREKAEETQNKLSTKIINGIKSLWRRVIAFLKALWEKIKNIGRIIRDSIRDIFDSIFGKKMSPKETADMLNDSVTKTSTSTALVPIPKGNVIPVSELRQAKKNCEDAVKDQYSDAAKKVFKEMYGDAKYHRALKVLGTLCIYGNDDDFILIPDFLRAPSHLRSMDISRIFTGKMSEAHIKQIMDDSRKGNSAYYIEYKSQAQKAIDTIQKWINVAETENLPATTELRNLLSKIAADSQITLSTAIKFCNSVIADLKKVSAAA